MITMKGAAVSAKLKEQVEKGLETLTWVPKLTIIRVGENPDDISIENVLRQALTLIATMPLTSVFETISIFAVVFLARRMAMKHAWKVAIAAGTVIYLVLMMAGYMMLHLEIGISWILIGTLISAAVAFLLEQLFFNLDYRKIENLQFEDNDYYYYVKAVPKRHRNDEDSQEMEAGRIDRKGREHHDGHETIHS